MRKSFTFEAYKTQSDNHMGIAKAEALNFADRGTKIEDILLKLERERLTSRSELKHEVIKWSLSKLKHRPRRDYSSSGFTVRRDPTR